MVPLDRDPAHRQRVREAERHRAAGDAADAAEWQLLRDALEARGIDSTDLGRFVSNTRYFRASVFDERAAMPVLLDLLPSLTRPGVVTAVAGHLRRPWARPGAFPALLTAFYRWAPQDTHTAWAIGDALAAAGKQHLPELVAIAQNPGYGAARAMIVDSLWRFRKDGRVAEVIIGCSTTRT